MVGLMTSECNGQDCTVGIFLFKVQTFKVIQDNAHSGIPRKPPGEKAALRRLLLSITEGPHPQGIPRLHRGLGLPAHSTFLSGFCLLLFSLLPDSSGIHTCLWTRLPWLTPFPVFLREAAPQSEQAITRLLLNGCPVVSHSFLGLCRLPEPVSWTLYFLLNAPFYVLAQRDGEGGRDLILSYKLRVCFNELLSRSCTQSSTVGA